MIRSDDGTGLSREPPGASPRARAWAKRMTAPVEAFLHIEAASGIVLFVATAFAMIVASSAWAGAFHHVLEAPVGLRFGEWILERPLHFWINDGLMTVFFFVVGLEIRREIYEGELATVRRAVLPAVAALGGMIAPALIYFAIAGRNGALRPGWGVPMATDIAFAVGVLALLGKRVPPALRVLLLALAIIDDIGSIVVIAMFYSGPLSIAGLAVGAMGLGLIVTLQRLGVRRALLYVLPGLIAWVGVTQSGIHPTIAGVLIGLMTPARSWLGPDGMAAIARQSLEALEREGRGGQVPDEVVAEQAARIDLARREAMSPATRLQRLLHPWVAFVIMPIFALANAGVPLSAEALRPTGLGVAIVLALVVGKPLGITLACGLAVRSGLASLPKGIGYREIVVLGLVAGIGFTMALFVAALAFSSPELLERAKAAVLVASAIAMVLGLVVGRVLLAPTPSRGAAESALEAERSDEV